MSIYLHTFEKPVFVANFIPEKIDWQLMLRTNKGSEIPVLPGKKEDVSSDISVGPRRSVLRTYESPTNREDTIGELTAYKKIETSLRRQKEREAQESEVLISNIIIDISHPFAPVYQSGKEGVLIYRIVRYVPLIEVRTEDLSKVLAYA